MTADPLLKALAELREAADAAHRAHQRWDWYKFDPYRITSDVWEKVRADTKGSLISAIAATLDAIGDGAKLLPTETHAEIIEKASEQVIRGNRLTQDRARLIEALERAREFAERERGAWSDYGVVGGVHVSEAAALAIDAILAEMKGT